MIKNYFDKTPRKDGIKKDLNQKAPVTIEENTDPIEEEDKEMYFDMDSLSLNPNDEAKDEEEMVTPNKDKGLDLKAANHFIMNLQEKLIKEKEKRQQSHSEAMRFLDSIQKSLNDYSQGAFNNPLASLENTGMTGDNTEMTGISDMREEEDVDEAGDDDDEDGPKKGSYIKISKNIIKTKGMFFIEMMVLNRKHLVGPYACQSSTNTAIKRFYERARFMNISAFQRELKQVKNYLAKRNAYRIG